MARLHTPEDPPLDRSAARPPDRSAHRCPTAGAPTRRDRPTPVARPYLAPGVPGPSPAPRHRPGARCRPGGAPPAARRRRPRDLEVMSMSSTKRTGDGTRQPRRTSRCRPVAEFADLRRRFRSFVFPMTALFLVWYFLYVLLAAYAPDFMANKVFGNINVGLLLGLGQFVSTFAITIDLRPLGRPGVRPDRRAPARPDRGRRMTAIGSVPALAADRHRRQPRRQHRHLRGVRRRDAGHRLSAPRATTRRRPTSTPAAAPSPARRTASPSPATTCRRPRFLGIAGAIAINGYDGFLYSIGFLVAWLVALLLVAELLRNTGRFTMADVLSFRLRQRPVRMAAAISTLVVVVLLPAGPDGRRRRPGRAAARASTPRPGRAWSSPSSARS